MQTLAGSREPDAGELVVGPRVSPGFFTQLESSKELNGQVVLDVVLGASGGGVQAAMRAGPLRPGRGRQAFDDVLAAERRPAEDAGAGARGSQLLLLDEPTDNLDLDSSDALEKCARPFEGPVARGLSRSRVPAHARPLPDGARMTASRAVAA